MIKVGGSLFDLPDLRTRLESIVEGLPLRRLVVVSGGGPFADAVRRIQSVHQLSDAVAHNMAMQSLSVGETLLSALLPRAVIVRTANQLRSDAINVVHPAEFVRHTAELHQACDVPKSWDFTSDSIAAWVASVTDASELVLLKSVDARSMSEANRHLDACFPRFAESIGCIRWCNLRRTTQLTTLRSNDHKS